MKKTGAVFSAFCLSFGLLACSGYVENESGDTSNESESSLIMEAKTSPLILENIERLEEIGWTVPSLDSARLVEAQNGQQLVLIAAERRITGDRAPAYIDLVYIYGEDGAPMVLMRPTNNDAAQALSSDLKTPPETQSNIDKSIALGTEQKTTGVKCDPGCRISPCKKWSCSYISKLGTSVACWSLWGNPLGYYHRRTTRTGQTNVANCQALYADYYGSGVICPNPSKAVSHFICGLP